MVDFDSDKFMMVDTATGKEVPAYLAKKLIRYFKLKEQVYKLKDDIFELEEEITELEDFIIDYTIIDN